MKKNKVTGLVGTIVLHVVLLLLLLLVAISKPKPQEEGGVPVMLGNMELAQGNADPYTLTDVDILDEPQLPSEVSAPEPVPTPPVKAEMITQEDEPTVAVPKQETPKPKVKTEKVKKETPKKEPVKPASVNHQVLKNGHSNRMYHIHQHPLIFLPLNFR